MDLIMVITQNLQSPDIFAHHQNKQMLKYILQKKCSMYNSLKDIIMLEVSLDPHTMKQTWLEPTIQQWVNNIEILSKVAAQHPQSAYIALT